MTVIIDGNILFHRLKNIIDIYRKYKVICSLLSVTRDFFFEKLCKQKEEKIEPGEITIRNE